jgi:hypothetical protein
MIVFDPPRTPPHLPFVGQGLIAHDAGQIPPSLQKSNWSETHKFALHGVYFK